MLKSCQRAKTVGQQGNSADALQPLLIFVVKNVTANSTPKNDVIVTANQHHTPAVFRDCAIPSLLRQGIAKSEVGIVLRSEFHYQTNMAGAT